MEERDETAIPFAACFEPLVDPASLGLPDAPPPLIAALRASLSAELSALTHHVLYPLFDARRTERAAGDDGYRNFVDHCIAGGWDEVLADHPSLRSAIDRCVSNWKQNSTTLIGRWRADAESLEFTELSGAATALSDPHSGGKRVARIDTGGRSVFYKPRTLDPEIAFDRVLSHWNQAEPSLSLPRCDYLTREGYGWAGGLVPGDGWNDETLRIYHQRCGALIGLVYLLGGSDFHMDNVIATAAGPALIDLECLMQPSVAGPAPGMLGDDLLATGLLPANLAGEPEISGFGGMGGVPAPAPAAGYVHTNTASMRPRNTPGTIPAERNIPREQDGTAHDARAYIAEIERGFRSALAFARRAPETLAGWIDTLAPIRFRYLIRPTDDYAIYLDQLSSPARFESPASGAALAKQLVSSTKAVHAIRLNTPATEKVEAEGLLAGDVPIFSADADATDLLGDAGAAVETDYFAVSGAEAAVERCKRLSEQDIDAGVAVVRRCFLPTPLPSPAGSSPRELLLAHAAYLGEKVAAETEPVPPGSGADVLDLYDGYPGVGVFLLALGREMGEASLVRRGTDLIAPLATPFSDRRGMVGAAKGAGSQLLALLFAHQLTGDQAWFAAALRVVERMDPDRLSSVSEIDLFGGWAGLISALVPLIASSQNPAAIELAERCVDEIGTALADPARTANLNPGSLAHGRPGIALALARYSAIRRRGPLDPGQILRALEGESFASTLGMNAWCNGASGLTAFYAEAMVRHSLTFPTERLNAALAELTAGQLAATDHVCCGNAGRLAAAFRVSALAPQILPPELVAEHAAKFAIWAGSKGGYALDDSLPGHSPALFRGLSGIGYTFLCIAGSHTLPDLAGLGVDSPGMIDPS